MTEINVKSVTDEPFQLRMCWNSILDFQYKSSLNLTSASNWATFHIQSKLVDKKQLQIMQKGRITGVLSPPIKKVLWHLMQRKLSSTDAELEKDQRKGREMR